MEIQYARTGKSTEVDELGMREMQSKCYKRRDERLLLVKAPPASGKSRALMFLSLYKLQQEQVKRVIVAVPEKSIGRSFQDTKLRPRFFADWHVEKRMNLCAVSVKDTNDNIDETQKVKRALDFMRGKSTSKILVCTHSTLRNSFRQLGDDELNDMLFAIDEFHHTSADSESGLGEVVHRIISRSNSHLVAMTGSYFRGDGIPVLRPEDEVLMIPVTYNYYDQLNGYKYLKSLGISYHFYQGNYLTAINKVLDTRKKTLIHIPATNAKASANIDKYEQVRQIIDYCGTIVKNDYGNGLVIVRDNNGEEKIIADLVEDSKDHRDRTQSYLQRMKKKDDVDIIIAMGMAKEGFDWPWCEQCLTIGVRGSLTEVVQIIGRCTRDCEGKEHAQFINLIAAPDANQNDVVVAVNDMLKAITSSLLMEQVMAPSWNFKTKPDDEKDKKKVGDESNKGTLIVEGLREFKSLDLKSRFEEEKDEIKATILQSPLMAKALNEHTTPEVVNKVIIPRILEERFPHYAQNDDDLEAARQNIVLDFATCGRKIEERDGQNIINISRRFINIDDLSITLIDSINPFQRAYEIMSMELTKDVFKVIQETIAERKMNMTAEEAIILYQGPYQQYREGHNGQRPSLNDPDPNIRRLAQAFIFLRNLKIKKELGMDYNPVNKL